MKTNMKLISLLAAGVCAGALLCGFQTPPDAEENPNKPPVYAEESFEVSGRILETAEQVPEFTVEIPVKVIDANGNPVQNAGIAMTRTLIYGGEKESVFRERPFLDAAENPTLTDHEGRADLKYTGNYLETALFVFTPEVLADCWGKYIRENEYPVCTRYDVPLNPAGNLKEIVITVNPSENASPANSYTAILRRNGKPVTDCLCILSEVLPPEPAGNGLEKHVSVGMIPPLMPELLTNTSGKVSFENLKEGTWEMSVYDSKDPYNEDRTSNLVKTYTFTIDKKNPRKNSVILLPNK